MAEHLTQETFVRYRTGALDPDDLLAVDDHLAECVECQGRAVDAVTAASPAAKVADVIARGRHVQHCTYETLEAHVDGRLEALEADRVVAHLAECRECQEDLGDLRQARAMLEHEMQSAGTVSGLAAFWTRPRFRVAGVLVLASIVLGLALVPLLRTQTPDFQVAREPRQPLPPSPAGPDRSPTPAPTTLATLRDGDRSVVLTGDGKLQGVPDVSPAVRDSVIDALKNARVMVVATSGIAGAPQTLRGPGSVDEFRVLEPAGRRIETERPTFRWTAHTGARTYRVDVLDTSLNRVASSGDISAMEWTPASPLQRGVIYTWQVTATTTEGAVHAPAPPAPEARFAILDAMAAAEIAHVRRTSPDSHLVLAVLYARAGMPDDAQHELDALVRRNPESALARDLRASVKPNR